MADYTDKQIASNKLMVGNDRRASLEWFVKSSLIQLYNLSDSDKLSPDGQSNWERKKLSRE